MFFVESNIADNMKVIHHLGHRHNFGFIFIYRVWVVSKDSGDPETAQQIGHMNMIPVCTDPGGVFSNPKFESFGETLDRLNQMLKSNPLQGKSPATLV